MTTEASFGSHATDLVRELHREPREGVVDRVEMVARDGVVLRADIYHPADWDQANGDSPVTEAVFSHHYAPKQARDTIHHGPRFASRVVLPVIERDPS